MSRKKDYSPTGIHSGSRAEFVHESITSSHRIIREINDLLSRHIAVQGQIHLATEVMGLVNKILDSAERERSLKKPVSGNQEATTGLESTAAPPIEKLKLGGQPPKF